MDDLMKGSWHVACWWQREDIEIMVFFLHHGHMFYFRADDHTTMHKEVLTQETVDRIVRLPNFSYSDPDQRWKEKIVEMNEMLGIKEEPKREAPVKRETKPTPVTRVAPLEREDGQMRLF